MVDSAIFWTFAVMAVAGALGALLSRSIIYAALCLITVFLSIAAFFILNNADFLAIAQIIIYAVALTIIMLFAIMFTGDRPMENRPSSALMRTVSALTALYVFGLLAYAAVKMGASGGLPMPQLAADMAKVGSTELLGLQLFSAQFDSAAGQHAGYALPFELASILLLVAMIGAIIIAKKRFAETDELGGDVKLAVDTSSHAPEATIAALRADRLGQPSRKEDAAGEPDKPVGV